MKRTFSRGRRRWEDFIDTSDEWSVSDEVGNEENARLSSSLGLSRRRRSGEWYLAWRSVLRILLGVLKWIFLFWYYGTKILAKYLRTQSLGSVREPLERGSGVNITPFGGLRHNQASYFSGCNSSRSRLHFNFMEQRDTSSFSRSRILRACSSERELVDMPLESKESELRTLHEDVTLKNTLSEHYLESLESADQVTAVILTKQTSGEVSGFRHGDLIEGNWTHPEPKDATFATYIPTVTNQNLATGELAPPSVNMNKNVEILEESDFEEPSQIEEAMEFLQIGEPTIIHKNSEDSSNHEQPSQSSALAKTIERAETVSNEELLEGLESRIINYEKMGNHMESMEDASSGNEACLQLDFATAKDDEQQPLIALEFTTGPNNEASSNQTPTVSVQTEIRTHSEPKDATLATFIPTITNQNLETGELAPPSVNMNKNVEILEESDFEEPSQIEEAMEFLQIGEPTIIHKNSEDSSNHEQPSQSSALAKTIERAETVSNEELLEGLESRIINYEKMGNHMESMEDASSGNEACLQLDFAIAKDDEQQPLIALEFTTGPNNEASSNQTLAVSVQTEIQDNSRSLLVRPVPVDTDVSDNSPQVSSQLDQENMYTLQQTFRSLERKRRKLTRSKELTVLEEALLSLQGRSAIEIAQVGTSPTYPLSPFYPLASREAVPSQMQTSGLIVTPPTSSFWSGRRKKKIKWDNGHIVFQDSPESSATNSSKSTGPTSDDGSSTRMSVKRKLDY